MNTDQIKALKERADRVVGLLSVSNDADFRKQILGILARIEAEIAELLAMCVPRKVGDMPAEPYEFEPAEPPVKPEPENASPGVFSSSAIWKYST